MVKRYLFSWFWKTKFLLRRYFRESNKIQFLAGLQCREFNAKVFSFKLVYSSEPFKLDCIVWNYWKFWRYKVKGKSKIKVYGLRFWDSGLNFRRNLCRKSNIWYLEISWNFVIFSRRELFPTKIFPDGEPDEHIFFKWKLKLKSRQPFRNDITIVNMVEDYWILEWLTLLFQRKFM